MSIRDKLKGLKPLVQEIEDGAFDFPVHVRRVPIGQYPLLESCVAELPDGEESEGESDRGADMEANRSSALNLARIAALCLCEEDGTAVYPLVTDPDAPGDAPLGIDPEAVSELMATVSAPQLRAVVTLAVRLNTLNAAEAAKD